MFHIFYNFFNNATPTSTTANTNVWLFLNTPILNLKTLQWISYFTHISNQVKTNVIITYMYNVWPLNVLYVAYGLCLFSVVIYCLFL